MKVQFILGLVLFFTIGYIEASSLYAGLWSTVGFLIIFTLLSIGGMEGLDYGHIFLYTFISGVIYGLSYFLAPTSLSKLLIASSFLTALIMSMKGIYISIRMNVSLGS
jgi:hypothetical protein